jgi:hypothetical protein
MRYEPLPPPTDRESAERVFAGDDSQQICETLLSLAMSGEDSDWVAEQALRLSEHAAWQVRAISATALGHIARINKSVPARSFHVLGRLLNDPQTRGYAESALDDLHTCLPR